MFKFTLLALLLYGAAAHIAARIGTGSRGKLRERPQTFSGPLRFVETNAVQDSGAGETCEDTKDNGNAWGATFMKTNSGGKREIQSTTRISGEPAPGPWTCQVYNAKGWCANGGPGPNWDEKWNWAVGNSDKTAKDICCNCGGGTVGSDTSSSAAVVESATQEEPKKVCKNFPTTSCESIAECGDYGPCIEKTKDVVTDDTEKTFDNTDSGEDLTPEELATKLKKEALDMLAQETSTGGGDTGTDSDTNDNASGSTTTTDPPQELVPTPPASDPDGEKVLKILLMNTWETNTEETKDVILDAAALFFDADGEQVMNDHGAEALDYLNKNWFDGNATHGGDVKVEEPIAAMTHTIKINLKKLPSTVVHVYLVLMGYRGALIKSAPTAMEILTNAATNEVIKAFKPSPPGDEKGVVIFHAQKKVVGASWKYQMMEEYLSSGSVDNYAPVETKIKGLIAAL